MIRADYHGYTIADALRDVEIIVGRVRMANGEEEACLITGHGEIQKEVIKYLESQGLEPTIKLSNSGAIRVIID